MRDQVSGLQEKGIAAYQLSEKTDPNQVREIKRQLRLGHPNMRLLYVTPETLFSLKYMSEFDIAYKQKQIARLVIDEAHVIDEWGSTFRPTYRRLGEFRQRYPTVPITALTASATSEVRNDLLTILKMPKTPQNGLAQWVEPFNRKNLFYEVRHQGGYNRSSDTVQDLVSFVKKFIPEATAIHQRHGVDMPCVSGLVYCRLTSDCDTIAAVLCESGISAKPFYAKMSDFKKNEALDEWKSGKVECIVATIAFGMGVDQAHVRYVVHYDMPKSFEGYYQETGRAGRDGHMSRCLLYYSREDASRLRGLIAKEADRATKAGNDRATIERGKLRMVNSFKALQLLAESTSTCRHVNICRYFGERIENPDSEVLEKYCNKMCDICVNRGAVYTRSFRLNEEVEPASPIIHPEPLAESPDYFTLSSQACRNSLAAFHDIATAPQSTTNPSAVVTLRSSIELPGDAGGARGSRLASASDFSTPSPRPFTPRRALAPVSANALAASPMRAQTMDQPVDEGLRGGVTVIAERSPDHAAKKRKARDEAFKGIEAATPGGPYSFYNVASGPVPSTKRRAGNEFKVPFTPTGEGRGAEAEAAEEADDSAIRRDTGLRRLREAMMASLFEGDLAEQVLGHWGRTETGDKRKRLLSKVARELEMDVAKMARIGEAYDPVIDDTCTGLKLIRDPRGVALVTGNKLGQTQDPRVERLRHIETCFRSVRSIR